MHKRPGFTSFFFPVFTAMLCLSFILIVPASIGRTEVPAERKLVLNESSINHLTGLYDILGLKGLDLSKEAFEYAVRGYERLAGNGSLRNERLLSIIDFSLPSTRKRLFVIDVIEGKLLFHTHVAHGRNSGREIATSFSNHANSFKSSLGFYVTDGTYQGKHGFSLRLDGMEKGINDKALDRGIVMHAADYVSEKFAAIRGYIGRSQGCPALPVREHRKIIQQIKDGSCLFIYAPDKLYTMRSSLVKEISNV